MQQQSLLNTYLPQTWLGLVLAVSMIGLLCFNFRTHPSSWHIISDNLDAFQVRQYLLRRALEEDHLFVPANHPHLRVCFSSTGELRSQLTRDSVCWSLDVNIYRVQAGCCISR